MQWLSCCFHKPFTVQPMLYKTAQLKIWGSACLVTMIDHAHTHLSANEFALRHLRSFLLFDYQAERLRSHTLALDLSLSPSPSRI